MFFFGFIVSVIQAQTLVLSPSTPQPRLGEVFELKLDLKPLDKAFTERLEHDFLVSETRHGANSEIKLKVAAKNKGPQTIGPFQFTFNGTNYTSSVLNLEVIDSLPAVADGLW